MLTVESTIRVGQYWLALTGLRITTHLILPLGPFTTKLLTTTLFRKLRPLTLPLINLSLFFFPSSTYGKYVTNLDMSMSFINKVALLSRTNLRDYHKGNLYILSLMLETISRVYLYNWWNFKANSLKNILPCLKFSNSSAFTFLKSWRKMLSKKALEKSSYIEELASSPLNFSRSLYYWYAMSFNW